MHFGYPFCHSGFQPDALLGNKKSCELFFEPRIVLEDATRISGMAFDPYGDNHNLWVCTLGNGRDLPGRLLWFSLDEMREPSDAEDITPANAPKNFSPSDILMSPIGLVIGDAKNGELWLLK
jgi:glucose/arabinose dehydrogenase